MKALAKIHAIAACLLMVFPLVSHSQNVVSDWDAIASNTIVTVGGKSPAGAMVFFAYVHVAVYDSVNSITRRHKPFAVSVPAPRDASLDSAVIASAHDVLVHYFPAQQATLDADEASALGALPDSQPKADGISVGEAVAAQWIAYRAHDGVEAPIVYTWGTGPGQWQPAPPFPPPATPWLGQMVPFTYASASDFLPVIEPPPSLGSPAWTADFNLTKTYGALNGSPRSASQTEIGKFWADHPGAMYSRALRFLIADRKLDTAHSARLAAMQYVSLADSVVACFNAKYHYGFWRPYTAIHGADADGNPDTVADANWLPLDPTPGHPEYPAAHGCATQALAVTLRSYFHTDHVHYQVTSNVTATTHDFERFTDLVSEVDLARIFGGMHFAHSVLQGNKLGTAVACHVLKTRFNAKCVSEKHDDEDD